jgi:glutaredoxin
MSEPQCVPQSEPDPATDDEPAAEPEEFANRAERRAKGKTTKPQVFSKGKAPVGRGAVQSPRQYGNRRSG